MELRVHRLESEILADDLHYDGDLGALYTPRATLFRVWAPTASSMSLVLYKSGRGGEPVAVHSMRPDVAGTWVFRLPGDCHGIYYNYLVTVNGETHEVVDPYARAVGVNGERGMVVDLRRTNPEGWDALRKPEYVRFTDAVIYELHIRDLTVHKTSGIRHKGKFLGLTERGTRGPGGVSTGLDHLKELGVTHVHLLPVFDFCTVDEADTKTPQYNWGYDPLHYNVPEGSYATDPFDGSVRIRELKGNGKDIKRKRHPGRHGRRLQPYVPQRRFPSEPAGARVLLSQRLDRELLERLGLRQRARLRALAWYAN